MGLGINPAGADEEWEAELDLGLSRRQQCRPRKEETNLQPMLNGYQTERMTPLTEQ